MKWGVPETIGNLAQEYPTEVEKANPKLLVNTKDKAQSFAGVLPLPW